MPRDRLIQYTCATRSQTQFNDNFVPNCAKYLSTNKFIKNSKN